jgi:hypothetical protein
MAAGLYLGAPPAQNNFTGWTGTRIASVAANNLSAAVTYAKANSGEFTLLLGANINAGVQEIDSANQFRLTIIGIGGERTIQYNGDEDDCLFYMSVTTTSLTLGNNITLKGISNGEENLVCVEAGTLTMLPGSKITGHTTSEYWGTVAIFGTTAKLVMECGTISGNKSLDDWNWAVGGVLVGGGGSLVMSGGSITGNTSAYNGGNCQTDVCVDYYGEVGKLILSGNTSIGALILATTVDEPRPSIALGGAYNGTATLHLSGEEEVYDDVFADLAATRAFWNNQVILSGTGGYALTAADVAKFTLGQFRAADDNPLTANISATHTISAEAGTLGRLVAIGGPLPAAAFRSAPAVSKALRDASPLQRGKRAKVR